MGNDGLYLRRRWGLLTVVLYLSRFELGDLDGRVPSLCPVSAIFDCLAVSQFAHHSPSLSSSTTTSTLSGALLGADGHSSRLHIPAGFPTRSCIRHRISYLKVGKVRNTYLSTLRYSNSPQRRRRGARRPTLPYITSTRGKRAAGGYEQCH